MHTRFKHHAMKGEVSHKPRWQKAAAYPLSFLLFPELHVDLLLLLILFQQQGYFLNALGTCQIVHLQDERQMVRTSCMPSPPLSFHCIPFTLLSQLGTLPMENTGHLPRSSCQSEPCRPSAHLKILLITKTREHSHEHTHPQRTQVVEPE